MANKKYYKIEMLLDNISQGYYIADNCFVGDAEDIEYGTKFAITSVVMDEAEFEELPEFQGW